MLKITVKEARISRSVRFTESVFQQLSKCAKENNISFNSVVLQCCEFALSEYNSKAEEQLE